MKENYFSNNLKYLRKLKGLNREEMAKNIGFSASTLGNYEANYSKPKFDDLLELCQYFGITLSDLVEKDLSKDSLIEKTKENSTKIKGSLKGSLSGSLIAEPNTKYSETEQLGYLIPNVFDFDSKASAGTGITMLQKDKYRAKPNLYLPGLGPGIHIRTPIGGDSMHNTIKDGDRVVATMVTELSDIRQGYIYIIVDTQDGLHCKRIYSDGDYLELISDNDIYKPIKRHLSEVLALFKVREVHTTDLRPYFNDLRREMREIRSEMADFRKILKGK